jgi:excisionase family DNA binding protein
MEQMFYTMNAPFAALQSESLMNPSPSRLKDEELITIKEALRILHISRSSLYRMIRRGELHGVRIGHAVRIRAEEVQALLRGARWFTLDEMLEEREPEAGRLNLNESPDRP